MVSQRGKQRNGCQLMQAGLVVHDRQVSFSQAAVATKGEVSYFLLQSPCQVIMNQISEQTLLPMSAPIQQAFTSKEPQNQFICYVKSVKPQLPVFLGVLSPCLKGPLKTDTTGTSLVVQWLRLHAPNAGGLGSIPGQGTRSHMLQLGTHTTSKRSLSTMTNSRHAAMKTQYGLNK